MWLHGTDPYGSIGPGRSFDWPYPLLYPFTAVLALTPFAALSMHATDTVFIVLSVALLTWTLTRDRVLDPRLLVFYSFPFLMALQNAQWSILLAGAAFVPALGFLLACKPTIGAALWIAYPDRRSAIGCLVFAAVSVAMFPQWIGEWRIALQSAQFISAPVLLFPGVAVLAAALRWRRPEARLLLALGCLPHQPVLYEALLLFLIPATWLEAIVLWIGTALVARFGVGFVGTTHAAVVQTTWLNWCAFLPCTLMVLRRRNLGATEQAFIVPIQFPRHPRRQAG